MSSGAFARYSDHQNATSCSDRWVGRSAGGVIVSGMMCDDDDRTNRRASGAETRLGQ